MRGRRNIEKGRKRYQMRVAGDGGMADMTDRVSLWCVRFSLSWGSRKADYSKPNLAVSPGEDNPTPSAF